MQHKCKGKACRHKYTVVCQMSSVLPHSYQAVNTALKQYNTNASRHVHHAPTNQTKASPVSLSLKTSSNLHRPLPVFSRTHPVHTHSAEGLSMVQLYHSSLHSFIYPQRPTGLWMARPSMTVLHSKYWGVWFVSVDFNIKTCWNLTKPDRWASCSCACCVNPCFVTAYKDSD